MARIGWVEGIGYCASLLVFCSFYISDDKVLQLYYQNPAFGFYLFRLVVQRMVENERRWRAQGGVAPS